MSNVRVEVAHTLPAAEVPARLAGFSGMLSKYGVKLTWKGNRGEVQGLGVSGDVSLDPGKVVVSLKLGLMARAAGVDAARLEAGIRKRLEEALLSK